jgi:hypothetical protein
MRHYGVYRFLRIFCCMALLAAETGVLRSEAAPAGILSVEGFCEAVGETKEGRIITLLTDGRRASGILSSACRYYLEDGEIPWEEFLERAPGVPVAVELNGSSGTVSLCRIRPVRAM